MSRTAPAIRDFVKDLFKHEMHGNKSSIEENPATFGFCDKMRPPLATLLGDVGYAALLSRALALAAAEVVWMRPVNVKPNGTFEGLEELKGQLNRDEFLEGDIVLTAQLIGLLEAFIGPALTSRLVGEVWPNFSLKKPVIGDGSRNEKTG